MSPLHEQAGRRITDAYPHVVVRLMAALYQRVDLIFGAEGRSGTMGIFVPRVDPAEPSRLTTEEREEVLRAVSICVERSRFRMCVLFGPGDCVYVERDGSRRADDTPPSGGVPMGVDRGRPG